MDSKDIVAKLIEIFSSEKDELLRLLKVLDLTKGSKFEEIIEVYNKVKNKEIEIVQVRSSVKLSADQRKALEKKLTTQFNRELIFNYIEDQGVVGGLEIRVGDTMINLNINII